MSITGKGEPRLDLAHSRDEYRANVSCWRPDGPDPGVQVQVAGLPGLLGEEPVQDGEVVRLLH
jgi:hypothetical protein